jgi:hypothetical protein
MIHKLTVMLLLRGLALAQAAPRSASSKNDSEQDFMNLMKTAADGWNEGNARKAADCFAEDAVYMEPPDHQVYFGRQAVYDFFGGPVKPEPPMQMRWHHLAFNAEEEIGYGEYTFQTNNRYHGVVTVLLRNGKIAK